MTAELKLCIDRWEELPADSVAEDVALAFIYLATKLDTSSPGTTWDRLPAKIAAWNARIDTKGART